MSSHPTAGLLALAIALSNLHPAAVAAAPARPAAMPARAMSLDETRRMDANRLNMFETNFGSWAWDIATGNAGLIFPRGSGKTAVFAAGLWIGAQVAGQTRVTVAEYSMEYVPGPMAGGSFLPDRPAFKVYKVHAFTGNPQDTAHVDRTPAELAADSQLDPIAHHGWGEYLVGAAPYGAPVRIWRLPDTSTPDPGDSVSVPGPDMRGDLMTWCVYNDADPSNHFSSAGGTLPLGIEVQQTADAFDRSDALGNAIVMRFKITNQGFNLLQNAYVTLWSDPDIGVYTDDVTGCDPGRALGFAYNGEPSDGVYGSAPPAVGVVLLRGPKPQGGTPLGMTAYTRYVNGTDPSSYDQSYNYMRGLNADGTPIVDPYGNVTPFMVSGDPLSGTGWLDQNPADRRMAVSSGPFTMAPGDTQIVEAAIVVSQGSDRLSSVGRLKCDVDAVRGAWASGFATFPPSGVCSQPRSCPLPASAWADACAGNPILSGAQLATVAQCVSRAETTFTWPAGQELARFCATLSPPGGGDLRAQAKREFAALVANVCSGALGIRTSAGDSVLLNTLIGISCPGIPGQTIGDLMPRAVLRKGLRDVSYLDLDPTHPRALAGVNWGGAGFMGGADASFMLFGSALDPGVMPDSFMTVELHFDRSQPQKAYRYLRLERASDGGAPPQGRGYLYGGFREVPFTVWDVEHHQQLEVGFAERTLTDDAGTILSGAQQLATFDSTWAPDDSNLGGREYLTVYRRPYGGTPQLPFAQDGEFLDRAYELPGLYSLWARRVSASAVIDDGDAFRFEWGQLPSPGLDSMLVVLEPQPLSDPAVQQAYEAVISCLQPINAGLVTGVSCGGPTPTLISLVSAEADPGRVVLVWQGASAEGARVERSDPGGSWDVIGSPSAEEGGLRFEDRGVRPGARYGYRLSIAGPQGPITGGETWVEVPAAAVLAIRGLAPNPAARPIVWFSLPERSPASLEMIDVAGRRVAALEVGNLGPGSHHVELRRNGRMPPGIYLIRLTQRGRTVAVKGVLMR